MRQAAQKNLELQGCMPADIATMGYPLMFGSQQAINRAFDEWQKKRGITTFSNWSKRIKPESSAPKPKPSPEKPSAPKVPKATKKLVIKVQRDPSLLNKTETRAQRLERKRAYRLANLERIREQNRRWQQQRRAAMTPEERKQESEKVNAYRRKSKAKKEAVK